MAIGSVQSLRGRVKKDVHAEVHTSEYTPRRLAALFGKDAVRFLEVHYSLIESRWFRRRRFDLISPITRMSSASGEAFPFEIPGVPREARQTSDSNAFYKLIMVNLAVIRAVEETKDVLGRYPLSLTFVKGRRKDVLYEGDPQAYFTHIKQQAYEQHVPFASDLSLIL